ncbi:hypothetical protein ACM39_00425 [Chryseobacterium sp. FH2]|uniref:DUF6705 family protein n=1 Tax=Chryseobacterium sp. FH2 TaxID=1674291 RepID=UPI00065AF846|nr:DUF6705 family protein [Chryseobacterium sp. FH2]KMQ69567.1 hypothetical protein ACM39_00425 [Chryseobacterium sp. FH2]
MKNKAFLYLLISLFSISCKAQQYPLSIKYSQIPNNAYIKDMNNEYIGTWKCSFGNKEIFLYITKQEDRLIKLISKSYHSDVLLIKYEILSNNQIIESTKNFTIDKINITSMGKSKNNSVVFNYEGGKCHVGNGLIYLKYVDLTHLKWNFRPDSVMLTNINCPDYPAGGIKINLPYEPSDIIFTKQ